MSSLSMIEGNNIAVSKLANTKDEIWDCECGWGCSAAICLAKGFGLFIEGQAPTGKAIVFSEPMPWPGSLILVLMCTGLIKMR